MTIKEYNKELTALIQDAQKLLKSNNEHLKKYDFLPKEYQKGYNAATEYADVLLNMLLTKYSEADYED